MGITKLLPFIEEKFPQAVGTFDIDEIKGSRLAIDAHAWMYANRATVQKRIITAQNMTDTLEPDRSAILTAWIKACLDFSLRWLAHDITPIFCFDGPKSLVEKKETIEERKKARKEVRDEIGRMRQTLSEGDPLARDPALLAKYRTKLIYLITITQEEIKALQACLRAVGIVCLTAVADGEKLCSMLCREGLVRAVFSPDTDNIVYACPLLITSLIHNEVKSTSLPEEKRRKLVRAVRHDLLLKELDIIGWPYKRFIDLCIAAGCDYNNNMPGVLIKTAFRLLNQHKTLDDLAKAGTHRIDCLNHIRCREIFAPQKAIDLLDPSSEQSIDPKSLALQPLVVGARGILSQYSLDDYSQIFSFVLPKIAVANKPRLVIKSASQ